MAVCWAWARGSRNASTSVSGSTSGGSTSCGSKSLGSTFGSALSMSWGSSGTISGAPRTSRRRLCIWSRATFLDDVIVQLDKQPSDRGIFIHTTDCGITEHDNKVAAISYLKSLRRERRQPRPEDDDRMTVASQTIRRRHRSSPVPLQLNADDSVPSAVAEKRELKLANDSHSVEPLQVAATLCSGGAFSEAETRVPSDDGCKLGADGRLQDLQLVLDAASPSEFVGLAVILGGERGTIKTHSADVGFLVALDSGADVSLARIEASHVVECLPKWALADA